MSKFGPGPNLDISDHIYPNPPANPPTIPPMFIRIVISLTWCSIEHLFIERNVKELVQIGQMGSCNNCHKRFITFDFLKTLDFYKIGAILYIQ
jgi:hypothetical protein